MEMGSWAIGGKGSWELRFTLLYEMPDWLGKGFGLLIIGMILGLIWEGVEVLERLNI